MDIGMLSFAKVEEDLDALFRGQQGIGERIGILRFLRIRENAERLPRSLLNPFEYKLRNILIDYFPVSRVFRQGERV